MSLSSQKSCFGKALGKQLTVMFYNRDIELHVSYITNPEQFHTRAVRATMDYFERLR